MGGASQPCTLKAIAEPENLLLAAAKARRGKSRRPDVETWWLRREGEVLRLAAELAAGTWQPGGYRFFEIREPKRRIIAAAPFADRVVHHALCNLMQPVLQRTFIARSFSCQTGKGTTAARACCRTLVNRHRFVLKCDVRRFFPSIDHAMLLEMLGRRIGDRGAMALCRRIVASHRTDAEGRPCGLPIGNLTSQLWGNFHLDGLDHAVTEAAGHGAYLRYTDDFLLFGEDKAALWELRQLVEAELGKVGLVLALPKSRLLACREGVPFCGFRFLPGVRPRILGATKRRFEARRRHLGEGPARRLSEGVFAWYQFSREGNSIGLRRGWGTGRGRTER